LLLDPWRKFRRQVGSDDSLVWKPPAEFHHQFGSDLSRRPRDKDAAQGLSARRLAVRISLSTLTMIDEVGCPSIFT
jgi:hypothetical protein